MATKKVEPEDFSGAILAEITGLLKSKQIRLEELVDQYAELIIKEIQATAPRSNINKRGKALADSFIAVKNVLFDAIEVTIFSDGASSYAHHVEYGTVDNPPQPYLRKAYDKYATQFENKVIKILKDGVVK